MLNLILNDGTAIELTEAGIPQHYVISCADIQEFRDVEDLLTPENISEIKVERDGTVVQDIVRSELAGTQTARNSDGSVTGHIYLSGGEFINDDAEYTMAGRILLGEEA